MTKIPETRISLPADQSLWKDMTIPLDRHLGAIMPPDLAGIGLMRVESCFRFPKLAALEGRDLIIKDFETLVRAVFNRKPLKIYILIRESVDIGHAVNCAAHASLSFYLRHQSDPVVQEWANHSFRKVSCSVTDEEFEDAKAFGDYEMIVESHLAQPEVALVFKPKREWDEFFKTLTLYGQGKTLVTDEQARILYSLPI